MNAERKPLVSVVCPVFNEEAVLPLFYSRLTQALRSAEEIVDFEFLFVNNASTDRTAELILELKRTDPRVELLTLSRNFGYQASISAGMTHARGDAIANIDVDGEDPPELIPVFIDLWRKGADVAYGIRAHREEALPMHLARKLFYRVTRAIADHDIVLDMAEFFLVDKRVRDYVLATKSTFPFVRGQVGYVGFRREGVPYRRARRLAGDTHYNLLSAAKFGIAGILSSSTFPLRALMYVGVLALVVDFALAGALLYFGAALPWETLLIAAFFLCLAHLAYVVFALGVIAIYVARIYKNSIALPLYVPDEKRSTPRSTPP